MTKANHTSPAIQSLNRPPPYILLIDDDEDDLEMLSSGLKKNGIKVKTSDSAQKALFFLTLMADIKQLPSLIITDYNMPKKNGFQFLLAIKDNNYTKHIPVVIYSTSISAVLKEQLSNAGASDCLGKPWNGKELDRQVLGFQKLLFSFTSNKVMA